MSLLKICLFTHNEWQSLCVSNSLYLLVFVSQRLIFSEESGGTVSYLDETLKKALLHIMRLFDRLIVRGMWYTSLHFILDGFIPRTKKANKFRT